MSIGELTHQESTTAFTESQTTIENLTCDRADIGDDLRGDVL